MERIKTLETKRLTIRAIEETDSSFVFQLRNDKQNMTYLEVKPYKRVDEAVIFVQERIDDNETGKSYFWIVEDNRTKQIYGSICLWAFTENNSQAEVGYHFLKEHQGHGYATEATKAASSFAFDVLQLKHLDGVTRSNNYASIAVLKKCKFNYIGLAKDVYQTDVTDIMVVYRMNKGVG